MRTKVIRSSSVDISQHATVAEFATRQEALDYVSCHSIDEHGNISEDYECDYLHLGDGITGTDTDT